MSCAMRARHIRWMHKCSWARWTGEPWPRYRPQTLGEMSNPITLILNWLVVWNIFPQQRKLRFGSSAIVKVPEQVGAAKSAGNRVPGKGLLFQENPSEQPNPHGARLDTGFPGRGSQARFPGRGSQGQQERREVARWSWTGHTKCCTCHAKSS